MNQTTKKQHYIWRSYLAPWTRDNSNKGQIFCRREGRIFPVSLMNVAHENYFYEVKELSKREIELIHGMTIRGKTGIQKTVGENWLNLYCASFKFARAVGKYLPGNDEKVFEAITATQEFKDYNIESIEKLHGKIETQAIADELYIPFNREVNNQLRGVSRMESLKLILRNSPVRYSEQEKFLLAEKKNNIYRELLQNITSKDLADDAWAVLEKLHAVHIPMAIGSSSKNTPLIVEKLGIEKFFDVIVDGNQISHSKPDPEVFLLAAEKLHQKPSDCLVVEDAEAGVKAALNGGFLVAGIGPAKDCPNVNYPLLSLSQLLAIKGWQT